MTKSSASPRAGFSLIEVLIAMGILVMVISVIGTGLVGVLTMEQDSSAQEKVVAISQWVNARRLEGADEDTIRLELRERWADATLTVTTHDDEDQREWERWTVESAAGGSQVRLEIPLTLELAP